MQPSSNFDLIRIDVQVATAALPSRVAIAGKPEAGEAYNQHSLRSIGLQFVA
jgi:hypothetical protein